MSIIDLHCDTISEIYRGNGIHSLYKNQLAIDTQKLTKAKAIAQFFAVYSDEMWDLGDMSRYEYVLEVINCFYKELEVNEQYILPALSKEEYLNNKRNGKITAFLTIEGLGIIEGSLQRLKKLYKLGVRLTTLTWKYPNCIGYPNTNWYYKNYGLTKFGLDVLEVLNNLDVIIDVSHLSDAGFYDVIKYSKKPLVASHSNSRNVQYHDRNLSDDMIKQISEKGGIVGISYFSSFLDGSDKSKIKDIVKHINHINNTGGIEVLALGSDFDGFSCQLELKDISCMYQLIQELKKEGYSSDQIDKITYKNAERVIMEVL